LEQVPDLIRRLKDENGKVRAVAAAGLAEIKPLPPEALEALLITVKETGDPLSDIIRISAVKALGNCDPGDGRAVKALTEGMLTDEAGAVQVLALQALKGMGRTGIPGIAKALTHSSPQMRNMAAFDLGRAGKDAKPSFPDLLKAMKDEQDDQTRIMMAGAALRLDPDEPSPIPVLIKGLDPGRDRIGRRIAADYLAEAGPRAKAAIPALEAMLTSSDPADVRVAKKALEKIKK
jgi:HEAT repeat protein